MTVFPVATSLSESSRLPGKFAHASQRETALMQDQRDNRRSRSVPARTNQGLPPVQLKAMPGMKVQRKLDSSDLAVAIVWSIAKRDRSAPKNSYAKKVQPS